MVHEESRKASPETRQLMGFNDQEHEPREAPYKHSFVPQSVDQFKHITTGTYNSPIRGSYSARRQRQKGSQKQLHRNLSAQKSLGYGMKRNYSAAKAKENLLSNTNSNGSAQSPTFRPRHMTSAGSLQAPVPKRNKLPPSKSVKKVEAIGKDSKGRPILSIHSPPNVNIDFLDEKPKNYQRKRISLEEEQKTNEWLAKINFYEYVVGGQKELTEDPFRNGVLLCELLCFLENIQLSTKNASYDNNESGVNYKPKTVKE